MLYGLFHWVINLDKPHIGLVKEEPAHTQPSPAAHLLTEGLTHQWLRKDLEKKAEGWHIDSIFRPSVEISWNHTKHGSINSLTIFQPRRTRDLVIMVQFWGSTEPSTKSTCCKTTMGRTIALDNLWIAPAWCQQEQIQARVFGWTGNSESFRVHFVVSIACPVGGQTTHV